MVPKQSWSNVVKGDEAKYISRKRKRAIKCNHATRGEDDEEKQPGVARPMA